MPLKPTPPHSPPPQQLPLALPNADEALVEQVARRLFDGSVWFRRRWPSFEQAWENPVVRKALTCSANGLLRNRARRAKKNRGG